MNPQIDIGDKEFIPFLKGLGVDTCGKSFEWMLNDPDFSGVLHWIYNNIDENNVLTAREEYRYSEIEKKGKVLSEEDLERRVADLQHDYPGICIGGDKTHIEDIKLDIKAQTEKLAMLERHEEILQDLMKQNELTNEELNVENSKLKAELQQSTEEETAVKEECIKLAEEVECMTNQVTNEVSQILNMYEECKSDKEISKRFFAFGPFDEYHQTQEVFKRHFDMYSSKMFYKTQHEYVSHNYLQTAFVKAQEVEERFSETVDAYIDTKSTLSGEQAKLDLIKNVTTVHPSRIAIAILEAKSKLEFLERENSQIEDEVLIGAVRNYVKQRTRYALDVPTRISLAIREELLRDMRFLMDRMLEALSIDRVLYGALRCELGAIERLLHFADQLRDYLHTDDVELRCRMKSMSNIIAEHVASEQNVLSSDWVLTTLTRVLGGVPDNDVVTPIKLHCELEGEKTELLDAIRDSIQNKEDGLDDFKKLTKLMMEYIYDGCTRRPNGRGRGAATVAHALRHSLDQVDAKVVETSGMFNAVKNGDQQNLRKLWQWFLADPARLVAAMKHLKEK